MRKLLKYLKVVPFVILIFALQGCLRSRDYVYIQIGTVKKTEISESDSKSEIYFLLDSSEKLYPDLKESYLSSKLKHNDRVIVQFSSVKQDKVNKEIIAEIKAVHPIRTEEIQFKSKEEVANKLEKSDKVNITEAYVVNGFMTLKYSYFGGNKPNKEHLFEIYFIEQDENVGNHKTVNLTLIHDAEGDEGYSLENSIISFPIDNIESHLKENETVSIKSKTIYNGIKTHQIKLKKRE